MQSATISSLTIHYPPLARCHQATKYRGGKRNPLPDHFQPVVYKEHPFDTKHCLHCFMEDTCNTRLLWWRLRTLANSTQNYSFPCSWSRPKQTQALLSPRLMFAVSCYFPGGLGLSLNFFKWWVSRQGRKCESWTLFLQRETWDTRGRWQW